MSSLLKFKFQYWLKRYHHWCMKISDHFFLCIFNLFSIHIHLLNTFLTHRRKIVWIKLVFYLPLAIPSFFLTSLSLHPPYFIPLLFFSTMLTLPVFHSFIFLNFFISNFIVTYFNTLEWFYLHFYYSYTTFSKN